MTPKLSYFRLMVARQLDKYQHHNLPKGILPSKMFRSGGQTIFASEIGNLGRVPCPLVLSRLLRRRIEPKRIENRSSTQWTRGWSIIDHSHTDCTGLATQCHNVDHVAVIAPERMRNMFECLKWLAFGRA